MRVSPTSTDEKIIFVFTLSGALAGATHAQTSDAPPPGPLGGAFHHGSKFLMDAERAELKKARGHKADPDVAPILAKAKGHHRDPSGPGRPGVALPAQ